MKKRQTMGKMMRDRELRERRAMKQQKKDERKLAAAEGDGAVEGAVGEDGSVNGDEPVAQGGAPAVPVEPEAGAT